MAVARQTRGLRNALEFHRGLEHGAGVELARQVAVNLLPWSLRCRLTVTAIRFVLASPPRDFSTVPRLTTPIDDPVTTMGSASISSWSGW